MPDQIFHAFVVDIFGRELCHLHRISVGRGLATPACCGMMQTGGASPHPTLNWSIICVLE